MTKSSASDAPFLLAADIGGTHSRFALFPLAPDAGASTGLAPPVREEWFPTARQASFVELLGRLRPEGGSPFAPPEKTAFALFAVAGPVSGGKCRPPNIAWEIRADDAVRALGIPHAALCNDFVAQGRACLFSRTDAGMRAALDIRELRSGEPDGKEVAPPAFPLALIGAGSGCGKALLLPETREVLASEGGHAEFPFRAEEEEIAAFLRRKRGKAIVAEMIASGGGLADLLAFHSGEELPPDEVVARLSPPRTGAEKETLACFARLYGRVCRGFVLETLALGGLYITGGVAARVPVLEHPAFAASFLDGGSMEGLLRRVPLFHVRSQRAGLWGAAACALWDTERKRGNSPQPFPLFRE